MNEALSGEQAGRARRAVVKKRDILAADTKDAMATAKADDDCPVCDVWHAGNKVGSIS